jgi:hypothetical protein
MTDQTLKGSTYDGPYMDFQEFISRGYLHEINRLVLHPAGLALSLNPAGHVSVWDQREDPEGVYFASGTLSLEKAQNVMNDVLERRGERIKLLGYVVQPFPGCEVLTTNRSTPIIDEGPPILDAG